MKLHNSMTQEMALFVAEQQHDDATMERFALWQEGWGEKLMTQQQFGENTPDWATPVWAEMANTLGHLWATQTLIGIKPKNVLEVLYLQNGLAFWVDWGYNPPVVYTPTINQWERNKGFTHATTKQKFDVTRDHIGYELTTTGGMPVAKVLFHPSWKTSSWDEESPDYNKPVVMEITSMTTAAINARADRLMWINTWAQMTRRMGGVVMCHEVNGQAFCDDNVVAADSLEEWAEIAPMLEQKLLGRPARTPRAD